MLAPELDIRTLLTMVSVIALVNAVTWATFGRRHSAFNGLGWFAAANTALASGMYLVAMRGTFPELATTVVANVLTLSGLLLNHEGFRRFAGAEWPRWRSPLWLLLPQMAGSFWITVVEHSVHARILLFTGLAAIGCAWIAIDLARSTAARQARLMPAAWVFGGFAAMLAVRWFLTAGEVTLDDFMAAGRIHAFTLVAYIAFVLFKDLGILDAAVSRLIADIRRLAETDPLTGLANRRVAMAFGLRALESARRLGRPCAAVMIDIDEFKSINDRHGHAIGDAVLVRVASLLANATPAGGLCARLGGEEFLLLLPGMSTAAAATLATGVRESLRAETWPELPVDRVSASFGVAACDGLGSLDRLIGQADRALLEAKGAGRDRVIVDRG